MDPEEIPKDGGLYVSQQTIFTSSLRRSSCSLYYSLYAQFISATVNKKTFVISCGDGTQRVKWLAHVAIARWDEGENQGWRYLGAPDKVFLNNEELDMGAVIKDVLRTGDKIYVTTSLNPSETR